MTNSTAVPPAPWARIGGVIYLGTIATGVFASMVVLSGLIVRGDAAATAQNIAHSESLFRLGIAAEFIGIACYVAVTAIFYELFKPVSPRLSLLAACFSLVGCAVGSTALVSDLAALAAAGHSSYLGAFTLQQSQALAYLFIKLDGQANTIGLMFFGIYCSLIGTLILRASFMPRLIGALMLVAGACWLIGDFASVLSPEWGAQLSWTVAGGVGGEAALTVWLIAFGVNVAKWRQQAAAA